MSALKDPMLWAAVSVILAAVGYVIVTGLEANAAGRECYTRCKAYAFEHATVNEGRCLCVDAIDIEEIGP